MKRCTLKLEAMIFPAPDSGSVDKQVEILQDI